MAAPSTPAQQTARRQIKYATFESVIELPFYHSLASHKINHDKLSEAPRRVLGQYVPGDEQRLLVQGDALSTDEYDPESSKTTQQLQEKEADSGAQQNSVPKVACRAEGLIKNFNTLEDFKNVKRSERLQQAAQTIWSAILDGTIYECPSLLASFLILSYADLKKYKFHHLFAFPAFATTPTWSLVGPIQRFDPTQTATLVDKVSTWRYRSDSRQGGFFLVKRVGQDYEVGQLGEYERDPPFFTDDIAPEDRYIAFVDPSTYDDNPGWPLRNLLVLVRKRWGLRKLRVLCYRDVHATRHQPKSLIMDLELDDNLDGGIENMSLGDEMPKVVGWEKNESNQVRPRLLNLSAHMDPRVQADINVDLNLKLMKWRVAPNLDLETIKKTRCLLLGAGTLGSFVGRFLQAWGVRDITFVDNGTVSFSNPVRQPLFNFKDCVGGDTKKAIRAAESLKEVYPGTNAVGYNMTVPMAAHPFTEKNELSVKADYEKLKELFETHDAIFLLMDTRESRWLPTVMGKAMGKLILNAALGFDTYLVARHGVFSSAEGAEELGCYYCNDVMVPGDSTTNATLDQQCTVTRPGIAPMASSLLVELLMSVLNHPLGAAAPAPESLSLHMPAPEGHPLGHVPHHMRGYLASWQNQVLKGKAYDCCSACSKGIVKAYEAGGWEFVKRALCEPGYVEEVSGLAEVQRRAEKARQEMEAEMDAMGWGSESGDEDEGSA